MTREEIEMKVYEDNKPLFQRIFIKSVILGSFIGAVVVLMLQYIINHWPKCP